MKNKRLIALIVTVALLSIASVGNVFAETQYTTRDQINSKGKIPTSSPDVIFDSDDFLTLADKIDDVNEKLEWKLLGTVTGNTPIHLPDSFRELSVLITPNGNPEYCINDEILRQNIATTSRYFPQMIPQNAIASEIVTAQFGVNEGSGYQLNYCYIGDTNVLSNTTSIIRYR